MTSRHDNRVPSKARRQRVSQLPVRLWLDELEDRTLLSDVTLATAAPLDLTVPSKSAFVQDTIASASDFSLHAVTLAAGERLTVDVNAQSLDPSSALDGYLRIFDSTGIQVALDDDSYGSHDPALTFQPSVAGTYYIGLSAYGNNLYDPTVADSGSGGQTTGDFTMNVSLDPGDTLDTAIPVAVDYVSSFRVADAIDVPTDVDMYALNLNAGDLVSARILDYTGLDPVLRVFDGNGTQVAFNDDFGAVGRVLPEADFQVPAPGTYYVAVSSFANISYDPHTTANRTGATTGVYEVTFGVDAANDRAYSLAPPIALTPGTTATVSSSIDTPNDMRLVALDLQTGDHIAATVDTHQSGLDSNLRVFTSGGDLMAANDDANGSTDSAVDFQVAAAGRYYVVVTDHGNTRNLYGDGSSSGTTTGAYELNLLLTRLPDLRATALAVPSTSVQWGGQVTVQYTLQNQGGADAGPFAIAFRLSSSDHYSDYLPLITVPEPGLAGGASLSGSITLDLPGAPDQPPAGFGDPGFSILQVVVDPANAVVESDEHNNAYTGSGSDLATLVITSGREAEPNNASSTANPLALHASVTGHIDPPQDANDGSGTLQGDVDYYYVVVPQDGRLTAHLTTDGFGGRLTLQHAYPADAGFPSLQDGQLLIQSDSQAAAPRDALIVQNVPGSVTASVAFGVIYLLKVEGRGTGSGSYTLTTDFVPAAMPAQPEPVGTDPKVILTADVNGDKIPDLVIANNGPNAPDNQSDPKDTPDLTGSISVLLGLGDGTFRPELRFPLGGIGPVAMVAGDFNGDGQVDLAVSSTGSNRVAEFKPGALTILLGNGDGTFQVPLIVPTVEAPDALAAADFNRDGILDLVGPTINHGVTFFRGLGNGQFVAQDTGDPGDPNMHDIVAADFNGDGILDIATANLGNENVDSSITVSFGNGDGTFGNSFNLEVAGAAYDLAVGDFNGDGALDIAVTTHAFDALVLVLSRGDGTFYIQDYFLAGSQPGHLAVRDFNGDGLPDVLVSNENSEDVSVFLGKGDGNVQPRRQVAIGHAPLDLVVADLNGDGRLDLATANGATTFDPAATGNVSVLLGRGDGTVQTPVANPVGGAPHGIAVGDFNGDRRQDLAVANSVTDDISILLGQGDGTLAEQVRYKVGGLPMAITVGDFNKDGRLDLAVVTVVPDDYGHRPGHVEILLGLGDGTFGTPQVFAVGTEALSIVAGQFNDDNGDGVLDDKDNLDLAVADSGSFASRGSYPDPGSNQISILLGNGDGTFKDDVPITLDSKLAPADLVLGDLNGDHTLDIAAAIANPVGIADLPALAVLLGNGDGTFRPAPPSPIQALNPFALTIGDFNGDGILDLATNEVSVFKGRGDGSFEFMADPVTGAAVRPTVGVGPLDVMTADVNGDGILDVVTANSSSGDDSVLLGNGDGTFASAYAVNTAGDPSWVAAADFNGDGLVDIANALSRPAAASVLLTQFLENPSPGTPPIYFSVADASTNIESTPLLADVNGDGTPDSIVLNRSGAVLVRLAAKDNPLSLAPPVIVNMVDGKLRPARSVTAVRAGSKYLIATADQAGQKIRIQTDSGLVDQFVFTVSLYSLDAAGTSTYIGSMPPPPPLPPTLAVGEMLGSLPTRIVAANLTGDGDTYDDLVVLKGLTGDVSIFLHNPDSTQPGGFDFLGSVSADRSLSDITIKDINGDGRDDIVVTNQVSGDVTVLITGDRGHTYGRQHYRGGTGLHTFDTNLGLVHSQDQTGVVAAADFNGDGFIDLIAPNAGANTLSLLLGDGTGSFTNPVSLPLDFSAAIVATGQCNDDNGDGRIDSHDVADLIFLNTADDTLSVYLGNGHGGFTRKPNLIDGQDQPLLAGTLPTGLSIADVNGDGLLDVQVGNAFGDVLTLLGNGDGTFQPFQPTEQTVSFVHVGTANDNKFILANQARDYVLGIGVAFAQDRRNGIRAPGQVRLNDLNGDGFPDLVVVNSGGNDVLVYLGTGPGEFDPNPRTFFTGTRPVSVTIDDLNGDKIPDLVVANFGSNDISVLLGNGTGTNWTLTSGPRLQAGGIGPVATSIEHPADGSAPNILVANSQSNSVTQLPGVGQGFFNDLNPKTFTVGPNPGSLVVGSFGGGTGTDFATVNADSITVVKNFDTTPVVASLNIGGTFGLFGDFTGDGRTDIAVANSVGNLVTLLLGGDSGLQPFETVPFDDPSSLELAFTTSTEVSIYASRSGADDIQQITFNGIAVVKPGEGGTDSGGQRGQSTNLTALEHDTLRIVAVVVTGEEGILLADLVASEHGPLEGLTLAASTDPLAHADLFTRTDAAALQLVLLVTGTHGADDTLPSWLFGARGTGELPGLAEQASPLNVFVIGLDSATGQVRALFRMHLPYAADQTQEQRIAAWTPMVHEFLVATHLSSMVDARALTVRLVGVFGMVEHRLQPRGQGASHAPLLAVPTEAVPLVPAPMDEDSPETSVFPEGAQAGITDVLSASAVTVFFGSAACATMFPTCPPEEDEFTTLDYDLPAVDAFVW